MAIVNISIFIIMALIILGAIGFGVWLIMWGLKGMKK